jgi:tetratricopeptide (TPR) repeat protein
MDALRKAVAAGYRDLEWIRGDSDLNVLRDRADFKSLEADLAGLLAATPPDKLTATQQALALRQKLVEVDPKNKRLRADLAASEHAIALIQLDLGKIEEAQKHLQQAITLRAALVQEEPKNEQYQADLAVSRFALGDFHWQLGRLAEAAKTWQRELDALEAAARQAVDRASRTHQLVSMRRSVAQHYARAGLFSEAATHYDRLIQLEGATDNDYYEAAGLPLRLGDTDAYRRGCAAMAKRFGASQDHPPSWMLAWICCLADSSGIEPKQFLKGASTPTGKKPAFLAWWSHVLALTHYRAGHFADAIAQADKSNALSPTWSSNIFNGPVLAMAHHRLGHAAEARKWLDQSMAEWRRLSPLPRSPGGLAVLPSSPSEYWPKFWHDWLTFEILLHEASVLIAGAPPLEAAFDHAHRSLLYRQLEDQEKAEAQWQAALKIAPREPALWLARARLFAQRGQHDKADADFLKAATLTPDELDRFPQAGWWVVGPYPTDLQSPCPPEKGADPAHPVAAVAAADDTVKQLQWRPAPTEADGRVRLFEIFRAHQISAYALTYVYSPQERTAALLVDGRDRVRVWLNGRLVHETDRIGTDFEKCDRVPVTLKAGRNTVLCRVSQTTARGPHTFRLRIGDNPLDRAGLYAALGLWDEAAAQFARGIERLATAHELHFVPHYVRCATAHLVLGDTAGYRRYLALLFEGYERESVVYDWLAYTGGLVNDAVKASRLVEMAESALERNRNAFVYHAAGMAHYRAGAFERAMERFEESLKKPGWSSGGGRASELGLALAHHRLGHVQEAQHWLDHAEQWYDKAIRDALASPTGRATLLWWPDWPSFVVLRREAHKLIRGVDVPDDPRLKTLADRTRDWLQKCDPATADYDVAIYGFPWQPRLRLARGRRLAELKRLKQAEADLDLAVQRKADDPEMWKERGRLYFQAGQTDKAAADFRKAVELLGDKALSSEPPQSEVDKLFTKVAEDAHLKSLTTAIDSDPENMDRRWKRGEWYAQNRRWKEAAVDFKIALERDPPVKDLQWLHAVPVLVAAEDHEGYRWICRELRKRFGDSSDPFVWERLAKVHLLLPDAGKDTDWAGQLVDRAVTAKKNDPWAPYFFFCKGLADYRRGNTQAAAEGLEALLRQIASQKDSDALSLRIRSRQDLSAVCHVVLAMSLYKQGQTKAAQEHFEQAAKLVDQHVTAPVCFPLEKGQQYSHDWLIAWLLHREAQTLTEGKKAKPKK